MKFDAATITLPKGGGALQGIGEKFSADLFTGTGNFTIPLASPPGRNGFQPQLSLSYSTGSGNGPFGLGWSLNVPGITRKTSKGVPRYDDTDVFVLSGAEDLVPVGHDGVGRLYRPRTEGLFARIRHVITQGTDNYWEVATKDGLTSHYGTPGQWGADRAAIADPELADRVFAWRLTETIDPFGNRIVYEYTPDSSQTSNGSRHWNQLYLKKIRYVDFEEGGNERFLVSIEFYYDDESLPHEVTPSVKPRKDAFSDYRSRFEIRTRRRCTLIVARTHPEATSDVLVRAYRLVYQDELADSGLALNGASQLSRIQVIGYDDAAEPVAELPPLDFGYTRFEPDGRRFHAVDGRDLPLPSLAAPTIDLVDLHGGGLPDILEMAGSVRYWKNLGNGTFGSARVMHEAPLGLSLEDAGVQLLDANGDGRADLLVHGPNVSDYFTLEFGPAWKRRPAANRNAPSFDLRDPEVKLLDLDGDGITDALRSGSRLECFFQDRELGWNSIRTVERKGLENFPDVSFSDPRVRIADMSGDGLHDIVLLHSGSVDYWPNRGRGDWGKRIHMDKSPGFPINYDPKRVLLGDVDGDGLADLIYVSHDKVSVWFNQSGNGWSESAMEIPGIPAVTDLDSLRVVDLNGTGTTGLLFSVAGNRGDRQGLYFLDLTGGTKPYLLHEMDNNLGAVTRVEYASSTRFFLADERCPQTRWRTPLPFPVQVVSRVEVIDEISCGKLTTEYSYHHGYWDGAEREFRGFGMVEQLDTESFAKYHEVGLHGVEALFAAVDRKYFSAPTLTKTWFHQGPVGEEFGDWEEQDYTAEYWSGDPQLLDHTLQVNQFLHGYCTSTNPHARRDMRDALRSLRGSILRTELYALDGTEREGNPYTVTEHAYGLRDEEPAGDLSRPHIFFPYSVTQRTTQWERGDDPLTQFSFTGAYDPYGQPLSQTTLAMPRRSKTWLPRRGNTMADETGVLATHARTVYAVPGPGVDRHLRNRVAYSTSFTLNQKPRITESHPDNLLEILRDQAALASSLHRQFEQDLVSWLPEQVSPIGYSIFAHTLSYYDGNAYHGEALGVLGPYGALTRAEILVFTDEILDGAYNDATDQRRPDYLGGTATLPAGAPANFGADHGYLDKRGGLAGYVPGYYAVAQQQKYDFHTAAANPRGLVMATRDPLNHETTIDRYDDYSLLPLQVTNAKGLSISAEYNLRVLQPRKVIDPNGNFSEVSFRQSDW